MRLKIEIEMDNAAFEDGAGLECARILRGLAENVEHRVDNTTERGTFCRLADINGNVVGKAVVTR